METPHTCPEMSPDERATRDLAKKIRKLRWLGMQEEAKRLQAKLSGKHLAESVLLLPADTD